MSTAIKVKANRLNALASTGPKSEDGKAIVAANAVRHGLLSWKPVVAEFESVREWDAHHEQTLLDLRPVGHLETLLAEYSVTLVIDDQRCEGDAVRFEFNGELTAVQDQAARALIPHDMGVLVAPPVAGYSERVYQVFGKDVLDQLISVAAELPLAHVGLPQPRAWRRTEEDLSK